MSNDNFKNRNGVYYLVECDPDWGMRWARDRKFCVVMNGPLGKKTLKKRLEKAAEYDKTAKRMLDIGAEFRNFNNPFFIRRVNLL